jgi:Family of unknown function (DUF5677)
MTNQNEEIKATLIKVKEWLIKNKNLNSRMTYNELIIDIGNHIRFLLIVITHMLPIGSNGFSGYTKNEVFIAGLLAKIFKIYDAIIYHASENQSDIVNILLRPVSEASQTMKYLISNPDKISSYRKSSFMPAIKNYNHLISIEKTKKLTELEKIMLIKIKNNVKSDDFDIDEMAGYNSAEWKKLKPNLKEMYYKIEGSDLMYEFLLGTSSSYIHSDWQDIKFNHITTEDGYYFPYTKHKPIDKRAVIYVNILILDIMIYYLNWKNFDPSRVILDIVDDFFELHRTLINTIR